MAGHSHWANISAKKGVIDKKRGKLFGKLSKAIIVAAQHGGPDPAANLKLRYAIDKARQYSMPKDNIERAIKRGCGESDGEQYSEIVYEGYGPAGVAIMCEILTENRNRTAGEIRKIFDVNGGNLGATGCVSWMFERKGLFVVPAANVDEEKLFETALENGADDVKLEGKVYEITCDPASFETLNAAFQEHRVPTDLAEVSQIASNMAELDLETTQRAMRLLEALEENDDVQSVTSNLSIPDELMEAAAQ